MNPASAVAQDGFLLPHVNSINGRYQFSLLVRRFIAPLEMTDGHREQISCPKLSHTQATSKSTNLNSTVESAINSKFPAVEA